MTYEIEYNQLLVVLTGVGDAGRALLPSLAVGHDLVVADRAVAAQDGILALEQAIREEERKRAKDYGAPRPDAWDTAKLDAKNVELLEMYVLLREITKDHPHLHRAVVSHCERKAELVRMEQAKRELEAAALAVTAAKSNLKRKHDDVGDAQRDLNDSERRCKEARTLVEELANK